MLYRKNFSLPLCLLANPVIWRMKENFKIIGLMENGLGQHNRLKMKGSVFLALPKISGVMSS